MSSDIIDPSKTFQEASEETFIRQDEIEQQAEYRPLLTDENDLLITQKLLEADICNEWN